MVSCFQVWGLHGLVFPGLRPAWTYISRSHAYTSGIFTSQPCIVSCFKVSGRHGLMFQNFQGPSLHRLMFPAPILAWSRVSRSHVCKVSCLQDPGVHGLMLPAPRPKQSHVSRTQGCKVSFPGLGPIWSHVFSSQSCIFPCFQPQALIVSCFQLPGPHGLQLPWSRVFLGPRDAVSCSQLSGMHGLQLLGPHGLMFSVHRPAWSHVSSFHAYVVSSSHAPLSGFQLPDPHGPMFPASSSPGYHVSSSEFPMVSCFQLRDPHGFIMFSAPWFARTILIIRFINSANSFFLTVNVVRLQMLKE